MVEGDIKRSILTLTSVYVFVKPLTRRDHYDNTLLYSQYKKKRKLLNEIFWG